MEIKSHILQINMENFADKTIVNYMNNFWKKLDDKIKIVLLDPYIACEIYDNCWGDIETNPTRPITRGLKSIEE